MSQSDGFSRSKRAMQPSVNVYYMCHAMITLVVISEQGAIVKLCNIVMPRMHVA